jgi:hypothetical protein
MNDAYYTQTGERPELAAIEVNPPEGYIGSRLMPVVPVAEKSVYVAYATLTADTSAQTNRSAGSGPSKTQIANSATTVTCAEACLRGGITPDEAKQMGGIAKADEVGAKWAKRQVMNAMEAAVRAAVFSAAPTTEIDFDNVRVQIQEAKQAIRLYPGRVALVGASETLAALLTGIASSTDIGTAFARIVTGSNSAEATRGLALEAQLAGLATFFGVNEVIPGDDTVWNAGYAENGIALVKIDADPDPMSHKWAPVFGKVFQFMPDGTNPWVIQSVADRVNVNNLYDAYLWYYVKTLNTAAKTTLAVPVSS